MIEFDLSDGVFNKKDVLTDRYDPDEIKERDDQFDQMKSAYRQMLKNGDGATNILIYGSTGVGKTVAVKEFLESIQTYGDELDHLDVEVIWENVKGRSGHKASVAVTNDIIEAQDPAKTGHTQDRVYSKLIEAIDRRNASHIVFALDEIDSLGTDDDLLYKLSRMDSHDFLDVNTKISIIGISNSFKYMEELSSRVREVLNPKEILFPEYNANELASILKPRAEKAFNDGVISDAEIRHAAALTARERGSARRGLDILAEAGSLADDEDTAQITSEHLERACEEVEHNLIKQDIRSISTQSQIIIQSLMMLEQKGVDRPRIKRLYSLYKTLAERADVPVRSRRTVKRKLQDLNLKDFVNIATINNGSDGGRYNIYELSLDVGMVNDVISSIDRLDTSGNQSLKNYSDV